MAHGCIERLRENVARERSSRMVDSREPASWAAAPRAASSHVALPLVAPQTALPAASLRAAPLRVALLCAVALCVAFCLLLAGCGTASTSASEGDAGGSNSAGSTSADGAGAGSTSDSSADGAGAGSSQSAAQSSANSQQGAERGQAMSANAYTTQELWVQNGDRKIYGVAYVPEVGEKVPLVIFSHELGNDHTSGERYAERLAQAGYAAYVFDFCGGTVGGNRSDGSSREMSVLTEASDLEAVLDASKTWDFVDADRIALLGGSMGGLVTTVVGSARQDEIAGMILMYPALSAKAYSGVEQYGPDDEIPEDEDVSLFGGWIHVGKKYVTDLRKVDFDQLLSSYRGRVLLLHGDKDGVVPISWSEAAREIIPDCEFHVIEGGGHEFFGQPFEDAMSCILPYLDGQMSGQANGSGARVEGGSEAQAGAAGQEEGGSESQADAAGQAGERLEVALQVKIGETPVTVEWEDNESVEALKGLCQDGPLTIAMSMYGGFEQVGPIGQSLPSSDSQMTTQAGDIVLYSGDQIVVFYGSNSWSYTKLGRISGKSAQELAELLGNGDVTITIEEGR